MNLASALSRVNVSFPGIVGDHCANPVLLAIAAAVTGVQGEPSGYEKQAVEDLSQ